MSKILMSLISFIRGEKLEEAIPSLNDRLVDIMVCKENITSRVLERILRELERSHFYSPYQEYFTYNTTPWPYDYFEHAEISVYMHVLDQLNLQPGMSFLCISCNEGFMNTAAGFLIGTYGVNHGIDLRIEIVHAARENVYKFMLHSDVIRNNEFCFPTFETGNVFHLTDRMYQRIYCGYPCPLYYVNIIKRMITIGGILIVVQRNKLWKVTRVSQCAWEEKQIHKAAPLSLHPLIPPNDNIIIRLPKLTPPTLMEIARSKIRAALMVKVDKEKPIIVDRPSFIDYCERCYSSFSISSSLRLSLDLEVYGRAAHEVRFICEHDRRIMEEYENCVANFIRSKDRKKTRRKLMEKKIKQLPISNIMKNYIALREM